MHHYPLNATFSPLLLLKVCARYYFPHFPYGLMFFSGFLLHLPIHLNTNSVYNLFCFHILFLLLYLYYITHQTTPAIVPILSLEKNNGQPRTELHNDDLVKKHLYDFSKREKINNVYCFIVLGAFLFALSTSKIRRICVKILDTNIIIVL